MVEMNDADRLELPSVGPDELHEMWDTVDGPFGPRHYDRAGNPISMRDWMRLTVYDEERNHEYKRVAQDTVGPYWISTVWLGLDHGHFTGSVLIFETMVFKEDGGEVNYHDLDMQRYSTEEEALAGHKEMVDKVRLFVELGEAE